MLRLVLLLVACPPEDEPSGDPTASATAGECEGTPAARTAPDALAEDGLSQDTAGVEPHPGVSATVGEGVLVLDYLDMTANCCPSPGADLAFAEATLTVDLWDVTDQDPCDCICVTDFQVRVEDLASGPLTVIARFNSSVIGSMEVEIP